MSLSNNREIMRYGLMIELWVDSLHSRPTNCHRGRASNPRT